MRYDFNFGTALDQSVTVMDIEVIEPGKLVYQVVIQFIDFVTVWTDATLNEKGHLIGKQIILENGAADYYENSLPSEYLKELGYKKAGEQLEDLEQFLGEKEKDQIYEQD